MLKAETDLKYVKNIDDDTNVVSMYIFSNIGGFGIDGQQFANELNQVGQFGYDAKIHINSGGGSVMDGISIMRAIQNFPNNIETVVEGIAASIAGIIAVGSSKRTMVDFGRIMIHDPMFSTDAPLTTKQKNALQSIRSMLIKIFENNSNFDIDELDKIMTDETWLDAEQCLELGLVDSIVVTDRNTKMKETDSTNIMEMVNDGFADILKPQIKKPKMENLKNHLQLDATASENDILAKIKNVETELATAKSENERIETELNDLKTENGELKNEVESAQKEIATNIVDNAIADGKFESKSKDDLIAQALEVGPEVFNKLVDSMKIPHADLKNELGGDSDITDGKSFRELEKSNPKILNKIKKENPALFKELYKKQYNVEPKMD